MTQYDAIIVGARCGGAPLAMLLARAGHKVLLVDRMKIGSDMMSTHYVKRTGAALLDKWGLLDEITRIGTPKILTQSFNIDGIKLNGTAPPCGNVGFDVTPRRVYLDRILVEAAAEAGVEVRDRFIVKELLFDNGKVCGIRGSSGGNDVEEYARIVVGADGANSIVANQVKAEKYVDAGTHTCGHYAYYSGVRTSNDHADLHILSDERRFYITFPTSDDLDMVFLFWPSEMAKEVRSDLGAAFDKSLQLVPELEARVNGATRETRISGTHLLPNFFRRAHGEGWALVGDAAIHRDPITAQGITNAFIHADILADELCRAFQGEQSVSDAARRYDERQFAQLKPMFDYTVHLAMLQPLAPEVQTILPAVLNDPQATSAFIGAFLGSVPLDQVFPPALTQRFANDVANQQTLQQEEGERRVA